MRNFYVVKTDGRQGVLSGDKLFDYENLKPNSNDGDSVYELSVGRRFTIRKDEVRLIPAAKESE